MSRTIVTITGPSCAGKSELAKTLNESANWPELISHTTRPQRIGERCGHDYHFISEEEYVDMVARNDFAESNSHCAASYGISKQAIESAFAESDVALVVIEPNGKSSIEQYAKEAGIEVYSIFVSNKLEVLMERMLQRIVEGAIKSKSIDFNYQAKRMTGLIREELGWVSAGGYELVLRKYDESNKAAIEDFIVDSINRFNLGICPSRIDDEDKMAAGL